MTANQQPHKNRYLMRGALVLLVLGVAALALLPYLPPAYHRYNPFASQIEIGLLGLNKVTAEHKLEFYPRNLEEAGGLLEIPKLGLVLDIVYGVDVEDLESAPGFYPQSGWPDIGNVCIAGHRNTAGNPFMDLDKLVKGDQIMLTYQAKRYTYEVDSVYITLPTDWSVIDPTPVPALTLTTCDPPVRPPDGKYNRLIVRSYLTEREKLL